MVINFFYYYYNNYVLRIKNDNDVEKEFRLEKEKLYDKVSNAH